MGNMSYCRMENTSKDLQDVYNNWNEIDSSLERKYRGKILELCQKIVDCYSDTDDESEK